MPSPYPHIIIFFYWKLLFIVIILIYFIDYYWIYYIVFVNIIMILCLMSLSTSNFLSYFALIGLLLLFFRSTGMNRVIVVIGMLMGPRDPL